MNIELYLPFPPSINNYYVKTSRGQFISAKGKKFRNEVIEDIIQQAPHLQISGKVLVEMVLFPPDNRRRDMDNYSKAMLDALTKSGIWEDDVQADQLFTYRGVSVVGGKTLLRITEAGPVMPEGMFPT